MRPFPLITFLMCGQWCLPQGTTEYILNGDFESGNAPVCWAQADRATHWVSQNEQVSSGHYFHSPDYYDDNIIFPAGPCTGSYGAAAGFPKLAIGARSGNRYMGVGTYELIQQEYVASLVPGLHYTVSMNIVLSDMFPSQWNGTGRLKIGFAKNRVRYINQNDPLERCTHDYVTYQDGLFQDIKIVGTMDLNISDYPPADGWRRISASFRAWDNIDAYEWFFIDVEIPGFSPSAVPADHCFGDFLYVDDVSLRRAEYCNSPCSPPLGQITHSTLPDAMLANGWNPVLLLGPFNLLIENAIGIDFKVFADWQFNAPIWEQYAFDPNGLHDVVGGVVYPDYQLFWIGEDADGNVFPQSGSYWYYLKMWNCDPGSTIIYTQQSLSYTVGSGDFVQPPDIVNYDLEDCCMDHIYYQNTTFVGFSRTDVHDHITAGSSVTSGTQGPVVVSSTAHVIFHAGNVINLEPGFVVSPGGQFIASVSDCIYGDIKSVDQGKPKPRMTEFATDLTLESVSRLLVWPNPTRDRRVHVRVRSEGIPEDVGTCKLLVMSMSGQLISEIHVPHDQVADLEFQEKGVYMVQAVGSQGESLGIVRVVVL